jgi:hypothetical protein
MKCATRRGDGMDEKSRWPIQVGDESLGRSACWMQSRGVRHEAHRWNEWKTPWPVLGGRRAFEP